MLTQTLWNNAFILSGKSSLFIRSLLSEGINYISGLIDCDGNFTCWNSMVSKFNLNINDFFAWFGVIQCVPSNWKYIIRRDLPLQTIQYDKINIFIAVFLLVTLSLRLLKLHRKVIYNIDYRLVNYLKPLHQSCIILISSM